jgi:hypothetical protein
LPTAQLAQLVAPRLALNWPCAHDAQTASLPAENLNLPTVHLAQRRFDVVVGATSSRHPALQSLMGAHLRSVNAAPSTLIH